MDQDRSRVRFEERECPTQNIVLERCVLWVAEWSTEREVSPERPRWLHAFGDGKGGGEGDRRDASLFDDVGERTHGARAERSNGGEKDDIDTIRRELGRGRWAGVVNDRGDIVGLVPSKRDMTISNRADRAVRRQLLKSIEREHDIVVEHESASVEVGAPVSEDQVAGRSGNPTEGGVSLGEPFIRAACPST